MGLHIADKELDILRANQNASFRIPYAQADF
jgi:hypothetical protein